MKPSDLRDLLLLALLWGGSFPLTRVAVPEFGPFPLIALRVGLAALVLLPVLAWRGELASLRRHWRPLLVVGLTAAAIPFVLFAWATLSVSAGFAAVINANTPLFTALVAYLWLGDRLGPAAVLGMLLGVGGVAMLAWDNLSLPGGSVLPVLACVTAALCYGFSAAVTRLRLGGAGSMVIAAGTQLFAALALLPLAVYAWPAQAPGALAWACTLALAVGCTGLAFVIFFGLMARVGAARAVTVTYLIPLVAMLIGALFLGERVTPMMLAGCGVILLGTALANGLLGRRRA